MKYTSKITFFFGLLGCLLVRLVPFRAPNVEPILAVQMPFAKKYGALYGFSFGALSVVLYDLITGTVGLWTAVTAVSYGLIGLSAFLFFKKREATRRNFVSFAVVSTLFYDAVTGLSIGPLFFHQPFAAALAGQIPFTILHLSGNIAFALLISPAVYEFLVRRERRKRAAEEFSLSAIRSLTI